MMRKLILAVLTVFFISTGVFGQGITERSVRATETLITDVVFRYQGVDIPVLDISYHEWSADSVTWRKAYQSGDCYIRFSNDVKTTWAGYNICTGAGTGTSQIDTIIVCSDGVCDTITSGIVTVNIPAPRTITGSTTNLQTDSTHTHAIELYLGEIENVDTTGIADGKIIKWNAVSESWVIANDLIGGGASGQLTVREADLSPSVSNVSIINVENGRLTDEGAGAVTIDFSLEPIDGKQDFFRTDTVDVSAGDTFLTFSSPLPSNDYIVTNAYALYSNGERQSLSYDSTTVNGFRVLDVVGASEVHYLVMRNLDSLGLAVTDQGKILASASDTNLDYLDGKTDDSTITVINNQLHAITVDSVFETNVYINADGTETLQDLNRHNGTPHISNGGIITDLGNDSVLISACEAYLKTTNSDAAILKAVNIPADTLYVPTGVNTTFFIDYNGGSPMYMADTAEAGRFYDNWDELIFATGVNLGDRIITRNFKQMSINPTYKQLLRIANIDPITILGDGIEISDKGTRQFSTEMGAGIFGTEYKVLMQINTSTVDTFTRMYYDAGWQRVLGEQTVNNTHYNDTAQGLVALGAGTFTNKWLYYVDDNPSFWVVLDGQVQYGNYTSAYSVTQPLFLPPELNQFYAGSELIGKFIVQEGRTEFIAIQNPFEENYGVPTSGESKSYSFTSQGVLAGTYYIAGFYDVSTTDANLTQAATTQSFGTANASYAAHPFIVAGGAGTVDAGTVGLRVTGTRIQDDGTRTPNYADTVTTDITSLVLNQYEEAAKFIGTVTYELIVTSGTPTTYSFDFNYGYAKYEDFGNRDFDVTGFEVVGTAGGSDASFNVTLIHHNDDDWTYTPTGFTITPTVITDLQTVHNTEYQLVNGEPFAFKRSPVNYAEIIRGNDSEGVIVRIVTSNNNSVQSLDAHIGVRLVE